MELPQHQRVRGGRNSSKKRATEETTSTTITVKLLIPNLTKKIFKVSTER